VHAAGLAGYFADDVIDAAFLVDAENRSLADAGARHESGDAAKGGEVGCQTFKALEV
jgi:hypothetical protein